jgi:hypothetical protein
MRCFLAAGRASLCQAGQHRFRLRVSLQWRLGKGHVTSS